MLAQLKGAGCWRFPWHAVGGSQPPCRRDLPCHRFAADHRDVIAELDINPLICAGDQITAVDALIVPKHP